MQSCSWQSAAMSTLVVPALLSLSVSDVLNASERDFLTLTEVTVEPLEGGPVELHEYLTLARRHIVFAVAASASDTPEG